MIARVFYWPGEWLAYRVTVRTRRAVGAWLLIVWLGPGTVLWIILRDALWFVGFMSLVALWWTGFAGVSAETPVENE